MNERERIELIMKSYGMTPSQFADRTGIQRASVSHIISGRNKPSLEVLQKIYDAFPELDVKWLMTGVGEEPVANGVASSNVPENTLFSQEPQPAQPAVQVKQEPPLQHIPAEPGPVLQQRTPARSLQRKAPAAPKLRQHSLPERRIKEIRIFYTDGTYETLYPEK